MKKQLFGFLFLLVFISCDKKNKIEKIIEKIPLEVKVTRFDKLFFETKPENLHQLKKEFPYFFPSGNDDVVWLEKMKNPQWRELYTEVQKKYGDFKIEKNQIESLFKHIKFYFPEFKEPKLTTIISEMDVDTKSIYTDTLVIIPLELYLGKKHKFYDEFPEYLRENLEQNQILPDIVSGFYKNKASNFLDKTFLSQMIYFGKQLYFKDVLLPEYDDAEKIGYTQSQIKWCQQNEGYIWRYFIEHEILFSNDQKLVSRFINPAPFSKFYLEIDNESPGRVGAWIGWQIVRAYVKRNNVKLADLAKIPAKEIFENSKYKPLR